MEIERKYLTGKLPFSLSDFSYSELQQGYISTVPVIRIRKKINGDNSRYILTMKSSGMLSRQEFEMDITAEEYHNLLKKVSGNIISKKRYIIPLEDGLKLELDVFEGAFSGLVMGEIEFPDEETADKYTPPAYLDREVTFDKRFHNSSMSNMSPSEISDFIASL